MGVYDPHLLLISALIYICHRIGYCATHDYWSFSCHRRGTFGRRYQRRHWGFMALQTRTSRGLRTPRISQCSCSVFNRYIPEAPFLWLLANLPSYDLWNMHLLLLNYGFTNILVSSTCIHANFALSNVTFKPKDFK